MKKQLVIIGIVALLVCIGLSGCQQLSGETSIADILTHSNNYINKTVTIRGQYMPAGSIYSIMNVKDGQGYITAIDSNSVIKPTPLVPGSEYKFTGIVRYGIMPNTGMLGLYFEVTKIETT
jgi:hypothetical protein